MKWGCQRRCFGRAMPRRIRSRRQSKKPKPAADDVTPWIISALKISSTKTNTTVSSASHFGKRISFEGTLRIGTAIVDRKSGKEYLGIAVRPMEYTRAGRLLEKANRSLALQLNVLDDYTESASWIMETGLTYNGLGLCP